MKATLRLTGRQHDVLRRHLFPGDGLEAVAVALCGRHWREDGQDLSVSRLLLVPHEACARYEDRVTWPCSKAIDIVAEAMRRGMAVVRFHSHPNGWRQFSGLDDASDRIFFNSVFGWTEGEAPHASAVMLPDGEVIARVIMPNGDTLPTARVVIVGDDITFWDHDTYDQGPPDEFALRTRQAFGGGTVARLRRLSAAVVGCSGTGSFVAEMLTRLGIGRLVLVDGDVIEDKNLSRILNATKDDAVVGRPKVQVLLRALGAIGLGTDIVPLHMNLITPTAVRAVASCDVVFGCMDGAEGRHALNRLAACYLVPYIDMGVRLDADGHGGVSQVCCGVNYLTPDGSTLLSRDVYTMEEVKAAALKRSSPAEYQELLREGYLRGVREDRPAVISVNAMAASLAVNEFLARIHPYRLDPNGDFARVQVSLSHGFTMTEPEGAPDATFARILGRGDTTPLLEMPELSEG